VATKVGGAGKVGGRRDLIAPDEILEAIGCHTEGGVGWGTRRPGPYRPADCESRVGNAVSGGAEPSGGRSEVATTREHVVDKNELRQRIWRPAA
jgi:hypothetical protein